MASSSRPPLKRVDIPLPMKLSGLWAAVMFCYAYADLIGLFAPGAIERLSKGELGPLGTVTQTMLLAIAACMAVPSVMVALSLLLPPAPNRIVNVLFGLLYTAIIVATIPGGPPFYKLFGVIEVALTLSIVWLAVRWPRASPS